MGSRAAAYVWQAEETRTIKDLGVQQKQKLRHACSGTGKETSKRSFTEMTSCHQAKERNLRCGARGLKKKFETKMIMVGDDDDMAKEARVAERNREMVPAKGNRL